MSREVKGSGPDEPLDKRTLFESFVRRDARYRWPVLVKRPRADAADRSELNRRLRDSYDVAHGWRHPHLLAPIDLYEEDDRVHLVYPYFRPEIAAPLTAAVFCADAVRMLEQIASALELIHQMGYVHCDLKAENILVQHIGVHRRVLVTDLDFLTPIATAPRAKIFGSPLHIAPEILRDEIVLPQSDFYSLGAMLLLLTQDEPELARARLMAAVSGAEAFPNLVASELHDNCRNLAPLITSLLAPQHSERPAHLGRALQSVLADFDLAGYELKLLRCLIRTRLRRFARPLDSPDLIYDFVERASQTFGMQPDLLRAADAAHQQRPLHAFRVLRDLLMTARITRVARFWQIAAPLSEQLRALDRLASTSAEKVPDRRSLLALALRTRLRGQYLAAARLMAKLLERTEWWTPAQLDSLRMKHAQVLRMAGFAGESSQIYRLLAERDLLSPPKRVLILRNLADGFAIQSSVREQGEALRRGYALARKHGLLAHRLRILERQVWRLAQYGRTPAALARMNRIIDFARRVQLRSSLGYLANGCGSFLSVLGRGKEADDLLTTALREYAEPTDIAYVPLMINLARARSDAGNYRAALDVINQIRQHPMFRRELGMAAIAEDGTLMCHVLLGDFERAEQTLTRLLAIARQRSDVGAVARFFALSGWVGLRSGQLARALKDLETARRLDDKTFPNYYRCQTYYYLGYVYLLRGDHRQTLALAAEIARLSGKTGSAVEKLDVQLLNALAGTEEGSGDQTDALAAIFREHETNGNHFLACYAVFHLLAEGTAAIVRTLVADRPAFDEFLENSGAVLAGAVLTHLRALGIRPLLPEQSRLTALKLALARYRSGGFLWPAFRICRDLAAHYQREGRPHIERRYLEETHRIAVQMMNQDLIESCRGQLEALRKGTAGKTASDALLAVSTVFRSISDYRTVVQKLLEFCITETGAERGAILVAIEGGGNLRVEAVIDCDDDSLEDILAVSRSVMRTTFESNEPLFVDDASRDARTASRASILQHNILSIACVPLIADGRVAGVLYLDHHSVPGIFHDEERRIIEAIANFAGAVLAHARNLRTVQKQQQEFLAAAAARGASAEFISRNATVQKLLGEVPLIARSGAPVLLYGESGTGKEIIANLLHQQSPYSDGPIITVNCANLHGDMLQSELFGVARGAATGVIPREGKLQSADGGTLFLDEIGDLPLEAQATLLRVLDKKDFTVVGSNRPISIDIRLIAATNRDLAAMVQEQRFRLDFYHRIRAFDLRIPPLREREDDIELLFAHYLEVMAPGRGYHLTAAALKKCLQYSWPGNVRELIRTVERIIGLFPAGPVRPEMLGTDIVGAAAVAPSKVQRSWEQVERDELIRVLKKYKLNQSAAARELGLSLSTFRRRLKKHGIDPDNPR